jgi:hypothetical protein
LPSDAFGRLQDLGTYEVNEVFTIAKGQGLAHHVAYLTAIDLAEHNNLSLYQGKEQVEKNRISPDQARQLATRTDWVQVTVRVFEGDKINLRTMTYEPARH